MILLDTPILAFDRYLDASTAYWARVDQHRPRDNGYVVVDLLHNNAAVMLGNLFIGRCAAHCYGARLAAVVCDRFLDWPSPVAQVKRLGMALGVERFFEIEPDTPRSHSAVPSWLRRMIPFRNRILERIARLSGDPLRSAVLDIAICGIPVGDQIYDICARMRAQVSTCPIAP